MNKVTETFKKMKREASDMRKDSSGKRFEHHYERKHANDGPDCCSTFSQVARISLVVVLLALSVLGGFLPILPGFVFFIVALVIMAALWKRMARWLDTSEAWLRTQWRKLRTQWRRLRGKA